MNTNKKVHELVQSRRDRGAYAVLWTGNGILHFSTDDGFSGSEPLLDIVVESNSTKQQVIKLKRMLFEYGITEFEMLK
ncbi:MAG: hypothetical protein NUV65_06925 [Candidatus Roizmanbacteria bacterium]|nr:hypothetical protein [Candidatus Roizmanbacteria bacterium]